MATSDAARSELAPTGRIRVGIAVSPTPSAIFAIRDSRTGALRGVTIDLGKALGQRLGVAVQFVEFASSGAITAAAGSGEWDVTFMPVDEERKKSVNFGSPFHVLQSTYLIAPGSPIASLERANQDGVRIVGIEGTATLRASILASRNATHLAVRSPEDAIELIRLGKAEALAMGRESLVGIQASLPGSRVLDGGFLNSTTAVAVPKNRPAALAYVSEFIDEAKASGLVRRALDAVGLKTSVVAPAGMKP
jgi:polar amino acid transport system substrate-binding protein